jgi:tetratricopeptide (TPR) repeat protein
MDPASADAKALLGWCHLAGKRWGDAAQRLEEAARSRPQDAELQAAAGYAYEKLGRRDDAVAAFDRAIALAPAHPTAHAARGATLEAMGEVRRALESYSAAAASGSPKAACAAKTRLAAAAYRERRFEDARRLAEEAVAADPSDAPAHHALGVACFALGDRRCASDQEQWLLTVDAARAADLRRLIAQE